MKPSFPSFAFFMPYLAVCWLGAAPHFAWGQPGYQTDETSAWWLAQGNTALQAGQPLAARSAFSQALNRPESVETPCAWHLLGHAYWQMGMLDSAAACWRTVTVHYAPSLYSDEARYHLAVALTLSPYPDIRRQGFLELAEMAFYHPDQEMARDAFGIFQEGLFAETDLAIMEAHFWSLPALYRPTALDAWLNRLVEANRYDEAVALYQEQRYQGMAPSFFAEQLLSRQPAPLRTIPGYLRMAVCMPLFLAESNSFLPDAEIPRQSKLALEYLEGALLAIEQTAPQGDCKYLVKVFDSRRDSLYMASQLAELEAFQPDVVIGDVYSGPMRVLADWAEFTETPIWAPMSPATDLIRDRKFVFLAHPALETHGARMAEHAFQNLGLKKVVVWKDPSPGTREMAEAFAQSFSLQGGSVVEINLSDKYEIAMKQISAQVGKTRQAGADGVYIPIQNNEESAGLILSLTQGLNLPLTIMGGPHWYTRYQVVDRHLKERTRLIFSTSFYRDPEDAAYNQFWNSYQARFGAAPSDYALYGYDLMQLFLRSAGQFNPLTDGEFSAFLQSLSEIRGIHTHTYYGPAHSNQFVNLCRFGANGIELLNRSSNSEELLQIERTPSASTPFLLLEARLKQN